MAGPLNLHSNVGIIVQIPGIGILSAHGTAVPANGALGFGLGCDFFDTSTGLRHVNYGTITNAIFLPWQRPFTESQTIADSTALVNNAAETVMASFQIPLASIAAGLQINTDISLSISGAATDNFRLRMRVGSLSGVDLWTLTVGRAVSLDAFALSRVVIRSPGTGANGAIDAVGFLYGDTGTGAELFATSFAGVTIGAAANTTTGTGGFWTSGGVGGALCITTDRGSYTNQDFTAATTFVITGDWSVASVSNSATIKLIQNRYGVGAGTITQV